MKKRSMLDRSIGSFPPLSAYADRGRYHSIPHPTDPYQRAVLRRPARGDIHRGLARIEQRLDRDPECGGERDCRVDPW